MLHAIFPRVSLPIRTREFGVAVLGLTRRYERFRLFRASAIPIVLIIIFAFPAVPSKHTPGILLAVVIRRAERVGACILC
jgi:hypothetical protein